MEKLRNLPKEYISVSQLNCYKGCPERYKRRYVLKEKPSNYTKIENLIIGSAFHQFVKSRLSKSKKEKTINITAFFLDEIKERIKTSSIITKGEERIYNFLTSFSKIKNIKGEYLVEEAIPLFKEVLLEEDYNLLIEGYEEELKSGIVKRPSYLTLFKNIINYYLTIETELLNDIVIKETEKRMEYTFERYGKEFSILAFLDFEGILSSTNIPIIKDWKLSKTKKNINDIQKDQDFIYSYLIYQVRKIIPEFRYVFFNYSTKTGNIQHQVFSVKHDIQVIKTVEASIHSVLRGINEQVFYKNESSWSCTEDYCEFYKSCQECLEKTCVKEIITQVKEAA